MVISLGCVGPRSGQAKDVLTEPDADPVWGLSGPTDPDFCNRGLRVTKSVKVVLQILFLPGQILPSVL